MIEEDNTFPFVVIKKLIKNQAKMLQWGMPHYYVPYITLQLSIHWLFKLKALYGRWREKQADPNIHFWTKTRHYTEFY